MSGRRLRWLWIAAAAAGAVLLVAGGVTVGLALSAKSSERAGGTPTPSSAWSPAQWSSSFTARGVLTLSGGVENLDNTHCQGRGGYSDIHDGTQVVVTDQSGTVIAATSLGQGELVGGECWFTFSVSVPSGKSFYGVTVSRRGTLQYKQDQLQSGLQLSLG